MYPRCFKDRKFDFLGGIQMLVFRCWFFIVHINGDGLEREMAEGLCSSGTFIEITLVLTLIYS